MNRSRLRIEGSLSTIFSANPPHVDVDLRCGAQELEQHQLASPRTDALAQAVWKANLVARARLTTRVLLDEQDEVRTSEAEKGRSVVEFRVTRQGI